MKEDRVQLARTLKTRARLARVLAVIVPIAVVAELFVVPWSIERIEFQQAKSDFAETWCGTFGTDASNRDAAVREWTQYLDRNRLFLESNWDVLGIDDWRVENGRGPEQYRDVLRLEAGVFRLERSGGNWLEEATSHHFRHHFSFFGFPGDARPRCD